MKKLSQFLLCFFVIVQAYAQTDSIAILKGEWSQKELIKGVVWKSINFSKNELFSANQVINIVEIEKDKGLSKLTIAYSDSLEKTSLIGKRTQAIAAINGSFFKMRGADPDDHANLKSVPKNGPSKINKNRSVVYLKIKDSLITNQEFTKDSVRKRHQQGVIAINGTDVRILKADTTTLTWESELTESDVISTGPIMLLSGVKQIIPNDAFCNNRHPRTAVGIKENGNVLLFVVDGRTSESYGMSIPELQKTLSWLGCTEAINLDGGGSSTMFIKGEPFSGVVNHPSDNKQFDHEGEREVANALVILNK